MTKQHKQLKAIFEVKFDPELMCDEETLQKEFGGSWLKLLTLLIKDEGMGIFDNKFKLKKVE